MNSRERVQTALDHREPDRIPFDLGATVLTSIHRDAYQRLRSYLGLPKRELQLMDIIQQIVLVHDDVRERLIHLAGRRIAGDGTLIIKARRFRTQDRNRQDAINRMVDLIRRAAKAPRSRRKTKPTLKSKRRRLEAKRHHSEIKRMRRSVRAQD